MIKTAILVNTLQSGGAERQSIVLFNILKKEVPTVLIVIHSGKMEDKMLNLIEGNKSNIIGLKGSMISKSIALYSYLKDNEITHLFNFLTKPNLLGSITGRAANVQNIYGGIRTSKLPFWKSFLEKIVANHISTGTIYNSHIGASVFKAKGFKRAYIISNCFPLINSPRKKNRDFRKIQIISVGRFVPAKDYLTSILVIKSLVNRGEDIHYNIVGYGKLEKQIRNWISKFNLKNHITVIINPSNIPELLIQSDIYLSTSIYEGTSNSIMEAMNASLPIVATNVGDNNQLIKNGVSGYINPVSDFESMSSGIQKLIKNNDVRFQMGIESNRILRENFSLKKFKEEYLRLLQKQ